MVIALDEGQSAPDKLTKGLSKGMPRMVADTSDIILDELKKERLPPCSERSRKTNKPLTPALTRYGANLWTS
jgi:hypothetical protein